MFNVYLMIGIPGSGKSTVANMIAMHEDTLVLSSDQIREELLGNAEDQSNNQLIFKIMDARLVDGMGTGINIIYDATNLYKRGRKKLVQLCHQYNYSVNYIWLKTDVDTCIKRQAMRDRQVPSEVICRMAQALQTPVQEEEGYDGLIIY